MAANFESVLRTQLADRRQKLQDAYAISPERSYLAFLLKEVDAAISRIDGGTFGLCEACHEPIEGERLAADPLVRLCLDHLTPPQQQALEQDLELAADIQSALLPRPGIVLNGWQATFVYEPAGHVSGDYCDLISTDHGDLYFLLGDVSGKGVAASMLMSHLHAMMRTLSGLGLPLIQMIERASRLFCESTLASHFATLVCGRAEKNGNVEVCNAGHLAPLLVRGEDVRALDATGLPLGLFCREEFSSEKISMKRGDLLFLFTDGLTEAQNELGEEFGVQRLVPMLQSRYSMPARELVRSILSEASTFRSGLPARDDLALMVIERTE